MSQNARITFLPLRRVGFVPHGITLLEAANRLGLGFEGPCGGAGRCGKDIVQIRRNGRLDTVLACRTPVESDLEVMVPCHETNCLKAVEGFLARKADACEVNPSIRKVFASSDGGTGLTSVYFDKNLLTIETGDTSDKIFGMALDLGTTTLVASLVDLNNGVVLGNSSTLNPLVCYGHDVISRIRYSTLHRDGLQRMHQELISAVSLLINILISHHEVDPEEIYQLAAAGNTTMQHIFLNRPIKSLGEYPYRAEMLDGCTTPSGKLALQINARAPVTIFPCLSAYVGGDIVAGLIATDVKDLERPALFIDIGTNGEMVLLTRDRILATSCAAGPCFEGMTISWGMRAEEGAIESVALGDQLLLKVIGGVTAKGICGSGLLELISELLRLGLINRRGRLRSANDTALPAVWRTRLFEKEGRRHFRLADGISVSQEDIRQVQLARAAIRTGVELLLSESGIKAEDLQNIIIAGGFGYHLSTEAIFRIGLIPEMPQAVLHYVGNSSLEGARRMLLIERVREQSANIAKGAAVIELSNLEGFEARFVAEMHFG
ncbi:MAG: ASKHA domain-containing protein [Deltaproteobacteria bacterium]|nr:ASKHA domain-containing protein [Deltaproteobacteria bacterium]